MTEKTITLTIKVKPEVTETFFDSFYTKSWKELTENPDILDWEFDVDEA